jgi:hypothetical protein
MHPNLYKVETSFARRGSSKSGYRIIASTYYQILFLLIEYVYVLIITSNWGDS